MKCTILWYGGSSYAAPRMEDAETFPSIKAAISACEDRFDNADGRTPCANEYNGEYPATVATVWFGDTVGDYPDGLITVSSAGYFRCVRA